ncbi:MAG: hypothetical protein IH886_05380 [Nitrospinae bacterium]|nr:hypothetical protein [Nitrospinota bacterium]
MSALSQIPVREFLEKVKARGVHLQANGNRIHVGWPEKTPDPEIREVIIARKPEILEALKEIQPKPYLTKSDDLVIQFDSDPIYHWWRPGGLKPSEVREQLKRLVN